MDSSSSDEEKKSPSNTYSASSYSAPTNNSSTPTNNSSYSSSPSYSSYSTSNSLPYQKPTISYNENNNRSNISDEHEKHKKVVSVLEEIAGSQNNGIQIDKNYEEDNKFIWLDEIDMLSECIKEAGGTISHIKKVNENDEINTIYNVHQLLLYKYNSITNWSFIEDLTIAGTDIIEYFMDGKTEYFGKRPNASGISRTAKMKLKKMRFRSSKVVSNMVQTNNLGFLPTLMMELGPAFIMQIKSNSNKEDTDEQFQNSLSNISNYE